MDGVKVRPVRTNRLGVLAGAASLAASLASLFTFLRYGHWHEELRRIRIAGESAPEWLTWAFVDRWKTASVVLAAVALPLAIVAAARRAQPVATIALVLALLALLTIPFIT